MIQNYQSGSKKRRSVEAFVKKEKMNPAIMYADDLCCFAASAGGLQDLLNVCSRVTIRPLVEGHVLLFNKK